MRHWCQIPRKWLRVALICHSVINEFGDQVKRDTGVLEIGSGPTGSVAAGVAHHAFGCMAKMWDKCLHRRMDLTCMPGFVGAAKHILSICPSGGLYVSLDCKMWIWLTTVVHGRSKRCLKGDVGHPEVRQANESMDVVMWLMILAWMRGLSIWFETPRSSWAMDYLRKHQMDWLLCHAKTTWLQAYGAPWAKPLRILSSESLVMQLKGKPTGRSKSKLTQRSGVWITGKPIALAQSAVYTSSFGMAIGKLIGQQMLRDDIPMPTFNPMLVLKVLA